MLNTTEIYHIKSTSPILFHRFSEDAEKKIKKDKNMSPKDQAGLYVFRNDEGNLIIPKKYIYRAIIEAGKMQKIGKSKMTTARSTYITGVLKILNPYIDLGTAEYEVYTDYPVNGNTGGKIVTHRPMVSEWEADLKVNYDSEFLVKSQVEKLISDAGRWIGVGSYRIEKKGEFGGFEIV
jgi:hypothetical protein